MRRTYLSEAPVPAERIIDGSESRDYIGSFDSLTQSTIRPAVLKPCAGRLVVGWVTTSEYLLLIFWGIFAMRPDTEEEGEVKGKH